MIGLTPLFGKRVDPNLPNTGSRQYDPDMTDAELKLENERLRSEIARLNAAARQIGVTTFLVPFLAAAGLMGATAAIVALAL